MLQADAAATSILFEMWNENSMLPYDDLIGSVEMELDVLLAACQHGIALKIGLDTGGKVGHASYTS